MEWLKWARYFDIDAMFSLIIGVALIAKAVAFYLKKANIFSKGITVKGEVVNFKLRFASKILSRVPVIRFRTEEGKVVESEYTTSAVGTHFEKGMEITVVYIKEKPTSFFLKDEENNNMLPVVLLIIGCMMIVIAIRGFLSI